MKVAIGQRLMEGPWGGGNSVIRSLHAHLVARGHAVAFDLADDDVDIVLLTDPRPRNPAITFTPSAILRYLAFRNPRALVVHRINECDERKGTRHMNAWLRRANLAADHTVFIAGWLKDLAVWHPARGEASVILNGADGALFNARGHRPWDGTEKLKLVTHHWGAHRMKGFDVYGRLDRMMAEAAWRDRLEFTYIGNVPDDFHFANARHIPPLSGRALADALRRQHVYVTGSVNEPAGMHHIEGALCGLPLLYRRSGGLPEYCEGFGEGFGDGEFEAAFRRMRDGYRRWAERMASYDHEALRMSDAYLTLFESLLARRGELLARRRTWPRRAAFVVNHFPTADLHVVGRHDDDRAEISGDRRLAAADRMRYLGHNFRRNLGTVFTPMKARTWRPAREGIDGDTVGTPSPARRLTEIFIHYHLPLIVPQGAFDIVDIGCGDGKTARYLGEAGYGGTYVGVDLEDRFDAAARREGGLSVSFVKADVHRFRPDRPVDLVLSVWALEHIADDGHLIAHFPSMLRGGGRQIHILPSCWTLFTYLWHGYRQYGRRAIRARFGDDIDLIKMGGAASFLLHFGFITLPETFLRVSARDRFPGLYVALLRRCLRLDAYLPWVPTLYVVCTRPKPHPAEEEATRPAFAS